MQKSLARHQNVPKNLYTDLLVFKVQAGKLQKAYMYVQYHRLSVF